MKIIEAQSAVLSNYEVLTHINSTLAKPRTTPLTNQNVITVLQETKDYLSPPLASKSPIPPYTDPKSYSPQAYKALMQGLEPFGLTKSEILMICNLRPAEQTVLNVIVEEIDDRFSEEEQEEMLGVVRGALGVKEGEGDAVGGAEEGGEGEGENGDEGWSGRGAVEARGDR